jgi:hypothetical protein
MTERKLENFVDDDRWLLFLSAELEHKQFPPAYAERVRNIRQILITHGEAMRALDQELLQQRQEVDKLAAGMRIASADLEQLWLRFQLSLKELAKHDAERAAAYAAYKPRLFAAFKPSSE